MKKVHLTENKFYSLIVEAMDVNDIHTKYYSDIPYGDYIYIVRSVDPTYDASSGKMGRYTKWLLGMYRKGTFKRGDFNEARNMLTVFEKYKNRVSVKDVTQLHSMGELYQVVKPFMEGDQATSKSDAVRKAKEGAEKVYEDDKWVVIIPHTKEAAILYGKHTKWCTAAEESDNMFDYYNNKGRLYINIDKVNNRKYQFHFETSSFMDEDDDEIENPVLDNIEATDGLKEYYKKTVGGLEYLKITKGFVVDSTCEYLLSEYKRWVDNGGNSHEKYFPEAYLVWNNDNHEKCCFVNAEGEIISDWYDDAKTFGLYNPARDPWRIGPTTYVRIYANDDNSIYYNDLELTGSAIFDGHNVRVEEWKDNYGNVRYPDWYDNGTEYGGYIVYPDDEEDE